MKRIATLSTLLALMSIAAPAWACMSGPESMILIGLILAPFMAIPYTLFGTSVIATQARTWFARPIRGWFLATFGSWFASAVGVTAGFGAAQLVEMADIATDNLTGALILSTPLVFQVAYLMWLHNRAPRQS